MNEITQAKLKQYLNYDPETGVFTRAISIPGSSAGTLAGVVMRDGYRIISICGKRYSAARLAWLYMHGSMPEHFVDHIDGQRDNNRIANLRHATAAENSQNLAAPKHNTSGIVGVRWNAARGKWTAHISVAGRNKHLGSFATIDEAAAARARAKATMHPFNPSVRGT